jgi:hypothetical protein
MANQVISSQTTIYHNEFTIYMNDQTHKISVCSLVDGKQVCQSYNEPMLMIMDAVRLFQSYLKTINGAL